MKNKANERKWYSVFLYILLILLFVILLPWIVVLLIKDSIANRKKAKVQRERSHDISNSDLQLMPYADSTTPSSNEEFISRINEFICLQYKSFNGLSGHYACQVVAEDDPIRKEQILTFLKEHPIENLLNGNLYSDDYDLDHWELRFIFDDKRLNRCIHGYGDTESSAPYLCGLLPLLRNSKNDRCLAFRLYAEDRELAEQIAKDEKAT